MVTSSGQDEQYLSILSIFHYVVGGLKALLACIPFLYFGMGWVMIVAPVLSGDAEALPLSAAGTVFVIVSGVMIVAGWALAVCMIYAGRCLEKRKCYTFCLIIAGIECISVPLGTILGIFTILVLTRPSVKEMFSS